MQQNYQSSQVISLQLRVCLSFYHEPLTQKESEENDRASAVRVVQRLFLHKLSSHARGQSFDHLRKIIASFADSFCQLKGVGNTSTITKLMCELENQEVMGMCYWALRWGNYHRDKSMNLQHFWPLIGMQGWVSLTLIVLEWSFELWTAIILYL